jgi:hypothetical protein
MCQLPHTLLSSATYTIILSALACLATQYFAHPQHCEVMASALHLNWRKETQPKLLALEAYSQPWHAVCLILLVRPLLHLLLYSDMMI